MNLNNYDDWRLFMRAQIQASYIADRVSKFHDRFGMAPSDAMLSEIASEAAVLALRWDQLPVQAGNPASEG